MLRPYQPLPDWRRVAKVIRRAWHAMPCLYKISGRHDVLLIEGSIAAPGVAVLRPYETETRPKASARSS
jgi:hypothetical protein